MKFDWNRPLAGAFGMALFVSLVLFGALVGMSFLIISQEVAGERLLTLWGPAFGAMIGASATISAAIYNQNRVERREQRRHVSKISYDLLSLEIKVSLLETELEHAIETTAAGKFPNLTSLLHAVTEARNRWDEIRPVHELPAETQALLNSALLLARQGLDQSRYHYDAERTPGSLQTLESWKSGLVDVREGRDALKTAIKYLGHFTLGTRAGMD